MPHPSRIPGRVALFAHVPRTLIFYATDYILRRGTACRARRRRAAPQLSRASKPPLFVLLLPSINHCVIISRAIIAPNGGRDMAHGGVVSIANPSLCARFRGPALLHTNVRFPNNLNSRNSFITDARAQYFSIPTKRFLIHGAYAPIDSRRRPPQNHTQPSHLSNRNNTSFKILANSMKTNANRISNRNKNASERSSKRSAAPITAPKSSSTNHGSQITNHGFRILRYTLLRQMSQCYIAKNHAKINRKPRRLEILVSHTEQTPETQTNRQLSATSPHGLSATPPHRLRHEFLTGTRLHSEIG